MQKGDKFLDIGTAIDMPKKIKINSKNRRNGNKTLMSTKIIKIMMKQLSKNKKKKIQRNRKNKGERIF